MSANLARIAGLRNLLPRYGVVSSQSPNFIEQIGHSVIHPTSQRVIQSLSHGINRTAVAYIRSNNK
jgi:hypothetical protein